MKPRLPDKSQDHLKKVPGPGAYGYEEIGNSKYYVTSKHPNHTGLAKMTQKTTKNTLMSQTIDLGPGHCNYKNIF